MNNGGSAVNTTQIFKKAHLNGKNKTNMSSVTRRDHKKRKSDASNDPMSPALGPVLGPSIGPSSPSLLPISLPISLALPIATQTNERDKDVKEDDTELIIEQIYNDKDTDFLKKLKKKSVILYHKFVESKHIIQHRDISIKDILSLENITNEKRANLIEQYECLQQIMPYTQDYIDCRNHLRNLFNRYSNKKPVSEDPDIEMFKQRIENMILSDDNKRVIEEKLDEFHESEKGDEKNKLKRWLQLATSLPLDKMSIQYDEVSETLTRAKKYLDEKLFGMKNVKERLLIFLNKKLRDSREASGSKGCNIALIGKPGVGKCLHPDTPVRMANLSIKLAKKIKVGDYLMGDDSTPREVTSTVVGHEEMYKITQQYGDSYIVNKSHILTLLRFHDNKIVDVPVTDVIEREGLYLPINGYFDGSINASEEAIAYGSLYSGKNDVLANVPTHFPLLPPNYLEWRLCDKITFYNTFLVSSRVYVQESYPIKDIVNLLQSAGIRCKQQGHFVTFPVYMESFRVNAIGKGAYCGFTISGNKRFLLGDWTVTHNTAIAKALSKCLDIPFVQLSFGGVTNPEFLLGHDYTYIGSRPGEISRAMSQMGSKNGILFFDEFDKASDRKEIMSTLLHITDFSQNNEFRDNYFPEICQDLSKVWFMYSMNELPNDPAMLDRLEVIHVDGYDINEKKMIAKNYLLPKFMKELSISNDDFIMQDKTIDALVSSCGNEKSGVRELERTINLLMEKIYFFLYNVNGNYDYPWFLDMKRALENINGKMKLVL